MLLAVLLFSSNIKSNAKEDNYIVKASNSFDEENDYSIQGSRKKNDLIFFQEEISELIEEVNLIWGDGFFTSREQEFGHWIVTIRAF